MRFAKSQKLIVLYNSDVYKHFTLKNLIISAFSLLPNLYRDCCNYTNIMVNDVYRKPCLFVLSN